MNNEQGFRLVGGVGSPDPNKLANDNRNLTSKTDRNAVPITYTYDQLNRLLQKLYPDSTAVNYTSRHLMQEIFFKKCDSRLTQVTDPTGTYQFTFDNMGRLTHAVTQYSFLTGRNFTTAYTYDRASNRTGFTDPEGGSTAYVYDTLNRLQNLTPPTAFSGSGNFGFSYDVLSRRTQMTRPNGITTNYSYDNLSRLLSVLHQSGSTTLDGATYTVDNAGNRTSKTDQYANVTSNYTYDPIYELTQVTQATTTTESYTYDAVGNRLTSLRVANYTNNTSNELTSTSNATYTYDSNGNTLTSVTGSNTTTYAWDFENRLTSITLPGTSGTVTFKYDPFGRRIYKSSSAATSVYAYDGDNLIEETNSTGTSVARYSQGLNIDEPLAMLRSSATSYYHADGLGSVTSLSNAAGALTQTYGYDAVGKQLSSTGLLTNPFQYTARETDTETGLYYYRARYYDSSQGRFLSEDPIRFDGGLDFYLYAGNSPASFNDPFGLEPQGCTDCKGNPKQGVSIAKSCCGNEAPMLSSAPNPYSPMEGYRGISAQQMFSRGGDLNWGNLVRGCLVCMFRHGADPSSAHNFCYSNSAKRAPLSALPGFLSAVVAAGTIGAEQAGAIGGALSNGQVPPFWAVAPIVYSLAH